MTLTITADGVQVHVVDDENGFLETPEQVRRLRGSGLTGLAARGEAAVVGLLDSYGITRPTAPPPPARRRIAVLGDPSLTGDLVALALRTATLDAHPADDIGAADLVVVATSSMFDPWAAGINARCIERAVPCLVFGAARDGLSFVSPLWSPERAGGCFECLRTRIASNSVHGPTWLAYMDHLSRAGARPMPHPVPPWAAMRLAATVVQRLETQHLETQRPDDRLILWEDGAEEPSHRYLLPVPHCTVCGGLDRVEERVCDMGAAVDDRVGIVHAASVRPAEIGPDIHLAGSTSADFAVIRAPMRVTRNGGAGFTAADAMNATIGESLERYAAGFYRRAELRLAAWRDLDERAVIPATFGLFSTEQYRQPGFAFAPFADDTAVRWVPAERLDNGQSALLPASQVYLHYRRVPGEAAIGPSISTGLAAGPTAELATLSGLYEVIERDALAISWLRRLPPRPVPAEVLAATPTVARHLGRGSSWHVAFYDISLNLTPPVIVAVMEYVAGGERVMSFGSACRWSQHDAVEKAFLEAAQGLTYVRRLVARHQGWRAAPDFSNVDDFNKHAVLYTMHFELRERAGYLVDPTTRAACTRPARPPLPRPAPAEALADVIDGLAAAGFASYRVDLTTPDVARVGVRVVRTVVPGLQHLAGSHPLRYLGTPRLHSVLPGQGRPPDNPFPHPLP